MDPNDKDKFVSWGLIDPAHHPLTSKDRMKLEEAFEKGELLRCVATATSGGVWSTGVDFPHLRVLVRMDGQGSPILNTQIPGRVTRTTAGKEVGIVIDFDDAFNHTLKGRAERRIAMYRSKGWSINRLPLTQK
jgi:superfamily II DNA or RNA helicase